MLDAVRSVYGNYANFSGRATRSEFWWFWLFYTLVIVALSLVAAAIAPGGGGGSIAFIGIAAFAIGSIIPIIAVTVRRLHDTGRSGWWLLLGFVPLVGGLILLFFYLQPSTPGPNAFGPAAAPAMA